MAGEFEEGGGAFHNAFAVLFGVVWLGTAVGFARYKGWAFMLVSFGLLAAFFYTLVEFILAYKKRAHRGHFEAKHAAWYPRAAKYEAEDAMARSGMQGEAKIICQQKSAAFEEWLKLKDDEYKAQRQTRIDMRGGLESDNESAYTLVEDVDEEEISYKEECVDRGGPRDSD